MASPSNDDGLCSRSTRPRRSLGHLRVLPAHEGRLLDGRRLRRGRPSPSGSASRCSWSRPAATPTSTSRSRRSRTAWRAAPMPWSSVRSPSTGSTIVVKEVRGKGIPVIDVINGMSSDDLSAKSLVSFGEMGFKAGEHTSPRPAPQGQRQGQGRLVPRTSGRRAGSRPATRASSKAVKPVQRHRSGRDQIRRHRQGSSAEAGGRHPGSLSGHLSTSSAPRRPRKPRCSCCATAALTRPGQGLVLLLHARRLREHQAWAASWPRRRIPR